MQILFAFVVTAALIGLGFWVGSRRENRHLADLDRREAASSSVVLLDVKQTPPGFVAGDGRLVMGEVVIAADYFKTFAAGLRNLIGGEVKTYQTMLSRARREAKMRMVEQALALGADVVINVRFEWSNVGPRVPSSEIFCYGTAVLPARVG